MGCLSLKLERIVCLDELYLSFAESFLFVPDTRLVEDSGLRASRVRPHTLKPSSSFKLKLQALQPCVEVLYIEVQTVVLLQQILIWLSPSKYIILSRFPVFGLDFCTKPP